MRTSYLITLAFIATFGAGFVLAHYITRPVNVFVPIPITVNCTHGTIT